MINLPATFLSLFLIRLSFLLVVGVSIWFVGLGVKRCFQQGKRNWRWGLFGFAFCLIGLLAYTQMISPADSLRERIDLARPRQPRVVFNQPGRALFFWETVTPLTGFVRYGFSPQELNYLARPDQSNPTRLHHVAFDEPVPSTGLFVIVYSGGKKYLNSLGEPFHLIR